MRLTSIFVATSAAALVAPVAGVALAGRVLARWTSWRTPDVPRLSWDLAWRSVLTMFTFVLLCGPASLAIEGKAAAEMIDLPVLATLGASFFGLVAMGTLCGSVFDDPLDGVACALALSLSAAFGVFAVGPLVTNVPPPLLTAVLAMTPVAATASAAGIDLFRSGPLYQLSPLAHTQFDYPAWTTASLMSAGLAFACLAASTQRLVARGRTMSARRMAL